MRNIKAHILLLLLLSLNLFSQNKNTRGSLPTTQNLPPEVFFSWKATCSGDTTCFINQTIRADTYTWTITDTSTVFHQPPIDTLFISNDTNICFHFPGPGTYSVSLHAYNNHDVTVTKIIKIDTVTKADFDFVRCINQFTNNSLCAASFYWDFGDGNTSALQYPIHQYAATGTYSVTLIAKNGSKSDTISKSVSILEISFVSTAFTYTISCDTVFVHAGYSYPTSFYWNFGDYASPKNFAKGRDTLHIYKDSAATYDIGLTAVNQCGPFFGNDSVRIVTPTTAFSYTVAYDTVFVHANYSGGASFSWNFGDPVNIGTNSINGNDAFHVYKDSIAAYNITLSVIQLCGSVSGNDSIKINLLPSRLNFTSNLSIVPNPANGDNINVYYNSYNAADYLAEIYNTMGEKVFEEYFSFGFGINGFKISTSSLSQGTYILVLQSEGTYARRKFLVTRKP